MSSKSEYIKQETVTGVVPMLKRDRQYSFIDLFLSTSGFAIATWCYTQGGLCCPVSVIHADADQYFLFQYRLGACGVSAGHICGQVRHRSLDLARSVLGKKGVAVFSIIISVANFGWYAVAAGLFSSSMINLADKFGLVLDKGIWGPILGCLCVVLGTLIALAGPSVIKW